MLRLPLFVSLAVSMIAATASAQFGGGSEFQQKQNFPPQPAQQFQQLAFADDHKTMRIDLQVIQLGLDGKRAPTALELRDGLEKLKTQGLVSWSIDAQLITLDGITGEFRKNTIQQPTARQPGSDPKRNAQPEIHGRNELKMVCQASVISDADWRLGLELQVTRQGSAESKTDPAALQINEISFRTMLSGKSGVPVIAYGQQNNNGQGNEGLFVVATVVIDPEPENPLLQPAKPTKLQ